MKYKHPTLYFCLATYGRTIAGNFMCMLTSLTILMLFNNWIGKTVAQTLCLLIYGAIIYGSMWKEGDRDRNKVQFGKRKYNPWKGFLTGLVVLIPAGLWNLLLLLSKVTEAFNFLPVYKLLTSQFWVIINQFTTANVDTVSWWNYLLFCALHLFVPLVGYVSYRIGYKGLKISEKIVYVEKEPKE